MMERKEKEEEEVKDDGEKKERRRSEERNLFVGLELKHFFVLGVEDVATV